MKKRLLSRFLTGVLILSMLAVPTGAAEMVTDDYNVLTVVSQLGIMAGVSDEKSTITRAEAVEYVLALLNVYDFHGSKAPFADVPENHDFFSIISTATEMGVIRGDANGNFRPSDEINQEEAIIMLLRAMGYDLLALAEGGSQSHYYNVAKRYGLLKNVSSNSTITNLQFAQMIYNTFQMGILEHTGVSSDGGTYLISESKTSLSFRNLTRLEGIVTENSASSIYNTGFPAGSGMVIINNQALRTGDTKTGEYLGYNVEVFIDDATKADEVTIHRVFPKNNKSLVVDLEDTEFSVSGGKLTYDNGSRNVSVGINPASCMVLNGVAIAYDINKLLEFTSGTVTFVDNGSRKSAAEYDMIFIDALIDDVIKSVDVQNQYIFIKNNLWNQKAYIELPTGDDAIIKIMKNGENISLDKIAAGNVISFAVSGSIATIYVSERIATGVVAAYEEGTKSNVLLNSIHYTVANNCRNKNLLTPGNEVTIWVNYKGIVIDVQSLITKNYGFVLKAGLNSAEFEPKGIVKLFTASGSIMTYYLAEKVTYNGESGIFIKHETIINDLNAQTQDLIVYNLNDNKEINEIWFAQPATGNILSDEQKLARTHFTYSGNGLRGYESLGGIGVYDTYLFNIPPDYATNEEGCKVAYNGFSGDIYYTDVRFYDIGRGGCAKAALILKAASSTFISATYPTSINVVSRVVDSIDSEGTPAKKIYYSRAGAQSSVFISDKAIDTNFHGKQFPNLGDAKTGDVFVWSLDDKGKIDKYACHYIASVDYDYEGGLGFGGGGITPYARAVMTFVGTLMYFDKNECLISFAYGRPGVTGTIVATSGTVNPTATTQTPNLFYSLKSGTVPVTIVNTQRGTVRTGSADELYMSSPESGSRGIRVLVQANRDVLKEVIVYE